MDASNADAYYSRGYSRYHLGRYKLAVSGFCDATILVPNDVEAYPNRGLAYRNDGQYDLAVVDFNHLLELNSKDLAVYVERDITFDAMALPDRPIEDFTQAISVDPTSGVAYANRALVLVFAGTVEKARADAERAIGLGVELETLMTALKLNIRTSNPPKSKR